LDQGGPKAHDTKEKRGDSARFRKAIEEPHESSRRLTEIRWVNGLESSSRIDGMIARTHISMASRKASIKLMLIGLGGEKDDSQIASITGQLRPTIYSILSEMTQPME